MQLKKPGTGAFGSAAKVSAALAAASTSLLAGTEARASDAPWAVDSALLVYSESDARVKVIEPVVSMKRDVGDERFIGLRFTLDALTGASPNGAIPSKETRTFTRPSGGGIRTAVVDTLPLDTFQDQRYAFGANWEQPLGQRSRVTLGGSYSVERDYAARSFNLALARDFFAKNTTLSLGFNSESDISSPIGGIPDPMTPNDVTDADRRNSKSRTVKDLLFGITQVFSRRWLMQLNYSRSDSTGYQNDPYKSLSVLNSNGTSTKDPASPGNTLFLFESRPDSRTRESIYLDNRVALENGNTLDLSLRHYRDDWGIRADTLDVRYRFDLGEGFYFEPHYRYYTQSAARFYRPFLRAGADVVDGAATLDYASSDSRLAKFSGNTFGVKWGYRISHSSEFSIRYEQYDQTGDTHPSEAANMSALRGIDLFPGVSAKMFLVEYSFEF